MSALEQFHSAHKARLARFAQAAHRREHDDRAPPPAPPMTHNAVKPRIRREYTKSGQPTVTAPLVWRILRVVAAEFEITTDQLKGTSQLAKDCLPRYVAIGLFLRNTQMSLPAIGKQLGGRDHTTVINGRQRLEKLLQGEAFRNRFEQIEAEVLA